VQLKAYRSFTKTLTLSSFTDRYILYLHIYIYTYELYLRSRNSYVL